jgi:hypothetical protein
MPIVTLILILIFYGYKWRREGSNEGFYYVIENSSFAQKIIQRMSCYKPITKSPMDSILKNKIKKALIISDVYDKLDLMQQHIAASLENDAKFHFLTFTNNDSACYGLQNEKIIIVETAALEKTEVKIIPRKYQADLMNFCISFLDLTYLDRLFHFCNGYQFVLAFWILIPWRILRRRFPHENVSL